MTIIASQKSTTLRSLIQMIFLWLISTLVIAQTEQKITTNDAASGDQFGFAVAIDGSTSVIGAWADDDNGFSSGSAYVFNFNGTTWIKSQKLLAFDGQADDFYGWSVDVSGDKIISGSGFDTQLGIFTNACDSLVCVTANDDLCALQSVATFQADIGHTYYLYITGYGTFSGTFQLSLTCSNPICTVAPTAFSSNVTTNSAQLNWSAMPAAIGYRIQGNALGGPLVTMDVPASPTLFSVNNLPANTTFAWTARANCLSGPSLPAARDTFTTLMMAKAAPEDQHSMGLKAGIKIFPNPATDQIHIKINGLNATKALVFSIYDLKGKVVYRQELEHEDKNLVVRLPEDLATGIYQVLVEGKNYRCTEKFLID